MLYIFREILAERKRVDEKWGEQNHPSLHPDLEGQPPHSVCHWYGVLLEKQAKINCDQDFNSPETKNWAVVAVEEMTEVLSAENDIERRKELVQLAQVVMSWIESIDRNKDKVEVK